MEQELYNFLVQYAILPIAVICYVVGTIIKQYIKKIPNKFIPYICAILGLILNLALNNFQFTFEIVLTGLGSGLASTGGWEFVRNLPGAFSDIFKKKEQ